MKGVCVMNISPINYASTMSNRAQVNSVTSIKKQDNTVNFKASPNVNTATIKEGAKKLGKKLVNWSYLAIAGILATVSAVCWGTTVGLKATGNQLAVNWGNARVADDLDLSSNNHAFNHRNPNC